MAPSSPRPFLVYGANGYTGILVAEEAARRGLTPILAGRREASVRPLAERLGLPWRAFPLDDRAALAAGLADVAAVLHCAGPFAVTAEPMLQACLEAGVHYLDITGELAVMEAIFARDADARARGVVLLPGVGFDVVPSDCLAACLKDALPSATALTLAFASFAGISRGTARTSVDMLPLGGAVRRDGRLIREPFGARTREVPFRTRTLHAISVPWGDISTAYRSTGIPDITCFMAFPPKRARLLPLLRAAAPLLRRGPVRALVDRFASRTPGPTAEQRRTARTQLWGEVRDAAGRTVTATLEAPEAYALTAASAVTCVQELLGRDTAAGAQTPARAFGRRLIERLAGCDLRLDPATPDGG